VALEEEKMYLRYKSNEIGKQKRKTKEGRRKAWKA